MFLDGLDGVSLNDFKDQFWSHEAMVGEMLRRSSQTEPKADLKCLAKALVGPGQSFEGCHAVLTLAPDENFSDMTSVRLEHGGTNNEKPISNQPESHIPAFYPPKRIGRKTM